MGLRRFTGQYADDGREVRRAAREAAGNRCVRCGHPFESGKHGKGEWSPCDEKCTHGGTIRVLTGIAEDRPWSLFCVNIGDVTKYIERKFKVEAQWRILTVHHLDGDKANDAWANTLPLCQRCHLVVQAKVDPRIPYFFEHSDWFKPYAAAYYAKKYLNETLTREEVMARLSELLKLERRA